MEKSSESDSDRDKNDPFGTIDEKEGDECPYQFIRDFQKEVENADNLLYDPLEDDKNQRWIQ